MVSPLPIPVPLDSPLAAFCRRWKVTELSLFGSALRDDFGADSDIDLLVTFAADTCWSLLDHARMEQELEGLLGRPVDLITRASVKHSDNPIRRDAILGSARTIYHAA